MDHTAAKLKVEQLIALAVNPGASKEEARTAAFLAVKLLHSSGLKVSAGKVSVGPAPAAKPAPKPATPKTPKGYGCVIMYAKFGGSCSKCGGWICKGEKMSYKASSKKMRHLGCF